MFAEAKRRPQFKIVITSGARDLLFSLVAETSLQKQIPGRPEGLLVMTTS
jgi:hypothetical protein